MRRGEDKEKEKEKSTYKKIRFLYKFLFLEIIIHALLCTFNILALAPLCSCRFPRKLRIYAWRGVAYEVRLDYFSSIAITV